MFERQVNDNKYRAGKIQLNVTFFFCPSESDLLRHAAVGIAAGTAAVVAAPLVLGAVGFTAGGVAAGSIAASVQSAVYGGFVAPGSAFALLQSAGAAGIGAAGNAAIAGITGGITGGITALGARMFVCFKSEKPLNECYGLTFWGHFSRVSIFYNSFYLIKKGVSLCLVHLWSTVLTRVERMFIRKGAFEVCRDAKPIARNSYLETTFNFLTVNVINVCSIFFHRTVVKTSSC